MSDKTPIYRAPVCQVMEIPTGREDDGWQAIQGATGGTLTDWGIKLLRSGLDGHVNSVLVEPVYVCKDYRNLFSHFYSKKFCGRSAHCCRLHFFGTKELTLEDVIFDPEHVQADYLGFSVIEPVAERCLGRTMIDPRKIGLPGDRYFCLRTNTKVHIQGADYFVEAFPYRSQSGEAIVCAHTALWSACRYLSERYPAYRELHPYDLIEMTGDANGRRVPYRGMTYSDYSTIFSGFGVHPAIIVPKGTDTKGMPSKDWSKDAEAFYDLYAYMESGFPVLTSFGGHVVNIIGHTMSESIAPKHQPKRGFYNSAALLKEYIVVDDNFFPYRCLGYEGTPRYFGAGGYSGMAHPPSIDNIVAAVVPLPEKVYLQPAKARHLAYAFLNSPGACPLIEETVAELGLSPNSLVARQFLTSASAFQRRKREYFSQSGDELSSFPIFLNLPHFVWIVEISALDLYKGKQCFGELVVDATVGPHEWEPIYTRIGRTVIVGGRSQRVDDACMVYPQYTHNLGRH